MPKGLKLGKGKRLRILMLLSVLQLLSLFSCKGLFCLCYFVMTWFYSLRVLVDWFDFVAGMSLERFLRKLTLIRKMLRG